ncbi:MAG: hypothetical protein NVSMB26_26170 [Beijerinckiaceae bacterium]
MMRAIFIAVAAFAGCVTGALSQEAGSGVITNRLAQARLANYVAVWSTNAGINPTSMAKFYADRVIYYGKPMSRDQVFRDKLNYIATWSERHYRIVPGTVATDCDQGRSLCRVAGLMQWDRRSVAGQRSVGAARLTLVLSKQSGARIVRESASILR